MERAKLLRSWEGAHLFLMKKEAIENRFNVNLDGIEYDAKFVFEMVIIILKKRARRCIWNGKLEKLKTIFILDKKTSRDSVPFLKISEFYKS